MITKCFILYYSIDFKAHLNLHSHYFTLMILDLWNGPLTGLSSISNLSLCVSVGANTANHHWLYNNFHQSLSFEYHPRLQLYREHQTHFFQFYSLHSHMTPVSTESFFLLRYLQKMKSTRAAKKRSFRGRATAVFLEDKGPNPEWDFVDGSPCSENYWCSSRKEEKYSFVRAVDQKCSNWSQNVKM